MKSFKILLGISILIVSSSGLAHAQFLNKLKRAAQDGVEKAVERRVTKEVETATQKQVDKTLESIFGPASEYEGSDYDYGKIFSSVNLNAPTEDSYHFSGYTDMEISGTDEKGKDIENTVFRTYLSAEEHYWGIKMDNKESEMENAVMIFDGKNNSTVILMENEEKEKIYMSYGADWNKMIESADVKEGDAPDVEGIEEAYKIEKTGNSKTVLGVTCEEYRMENEEATINYWVSKTPVEGYASFWSKNNFMFSGKMAQKHGNLYQDLPEGDVMEIHHVSKEDKGETWMKIVEINPRQSTDFILSEYKNGMSTD